MCCCDALQYKKQNKTKRFKLHTNSWHIHTLFFSAYASQCKRPYHLSHVRLCKATAAACVNTNVAFSHIQVITRHTYGMDRQGVRLRVRTYHGTSHYLSTSHYLFEIHCISISLVLKPCWQSWLRSGESVCLPESGNGTVSCWSAYLLAVQARVRCSRFKHKQA